MKVLLHHKCTVDARDHDGVTPLYLATYHGNYEVMKMLVGAFANVNAVTKVIYILIFTVPFSLSSQVFPQSAFRSLAVFKNGGGRPGPFYYVNDVSAY